MVLARSRDFSVGNNTKRFHKSASLDRLARESTAYDLARTLKVGSQAIKVARNLSARVESGVIGWARQLRELIAYQRSPDSLRPRPP